jgi:hypothetical protein
MAIPGAKDVHDLNKPVSKVPRKKTSFTEISHHTVLQLQNSTNGAENPNNNNL